MKRSDLLTSSYYIHRELPALRTAKTAKAMTFPKASQAADHCQMLPRHRMGTRPTHPRPPPRQTLRLRNLQPCTHPYWLDDPTTDEYGLDTVEEITFDRHTATSPPRHVSTSHVHLPAVTVHSTTDSSPMTRTIIALIVLHELHTGRARSMANTGSHHNPDAATEYANRPDIQSELVADWDRDGTIEPDPDVEARTTQPRRNPRHRRRIWANGHRSCNANPAATGTPQRPLRRRTPIHPIDMAHLRRHRVRRTRLHATPRSRSTSPNEC